MADNVTLASSNIISVTSTCSPDWAFEFTAVIWKVKGTCEAAFPHAANPLINDLRHGVETKKETLKKVLQSLSAMCIRGNPESASKYEKLVAFHQQLVDEDSKRAELAVNARAIALNIEPLQHIVVPVAASTSSKRKKKGSC